MKKILFAALLLWSASVYAQDADVPSRVMQNHNLLSRSPNSGIGIKGGVNFASVHGSEKDKFGDVNSHTSFHAGVFAQFGLGNFFSLQPELLYSRKGYERQDSVFRMDYLEVPVLAVFNISDNLSVHLGPQVGVMVSAKVEDEEIDMEPYNTFDYGLSAGLEGKLGRFRLGTRYVHGFGDLRKQDSDGSNINEDIKNGVIQVYLGIAF
ncbi:porin family protein [Pontibacter anaerobius]|uniref:Porin family protein n=1 Tax=Pontibacter anaerobius TaxID=2993940 RepID=A0ABT3RHY3_9BACT|nr:porin family protein [Pontibacter anaerobius]MCX2741244.1 porin family protein [Pontibacter anaerobius]